MRTQLHNYHYCNDFGMAVVVPLYSKPGDFTDAEAEARAWDELAEVVKFAEDWWLDNTECAICDNAGH